MMVVPLCILSSGCACVSGCVQAQAPRSALRAGYFAEMAADEGYPAAREPDGVTLIRDISCREGDESKDRAAYLLDVVTPSQAARHCARWWCSRMAVD